MVALAFEKKVQICTKVVEEPEMVMFDLYFISVSLLEQEL
jgi:hypothetical protein